MSEWATDMHGDPYCGECGKGYPGEISSHEEGCTVAAEMPDPGDDPRYHDPDCPDC